MSLAEIDFQDEEMVRVRGLSRYKLLAELESGESDEAVKNHVLELQRRFLVRANIERAFKEMSGSELVDNSGKLRFKILKFLEAEKGNRDIDSNALYEEYGTNGSSDFAYVVWGLVRENKIVIAENKIVSLVTDDGKIVHGQ